MDLSIIIVNWNTKDLLRTCLNSIYRHSQGFEFEIFVVDNASTDASAEMVTREFEEVHLIASNKNLGFAKGNNEALRQAKGDFLLLLNPDTKLKDNAFGKMLEIVRYDQQIGVLGPRLLNFDLSLQPSCRTFPTLSSQFLILLKLHNFWPNLKTVKKYYMLAFKHDQPREVDQVMGACFMISRPAFEKVGLLDPGFKSWFEEVDYCQRIKNAGHKVLFTPEAEIIHLKGESFSQQKAIAKQLRFNQGLRRYFRKHNYSGFIMTIVLTPVSLLLAALVQLVDSLGLKFKKDKNL